MTMVGQNVTLSFLAKYLSARLHRMVIDRTDLAGRFDFIVELPLDQDDVKDLSLAETDVMAHVFTDLVVNLKVVFPLPNGNAIVIMKPEVHADGSLSVTSSGKAFGDPGFYFVVHNRSGMAWARYLPGLKETIRVYAAESDIVRADHMLWLWGMEFLRLHYRMHLRTGTRESSAVGGSLLDSRRAAGLL